MNGLGFRPLRYEDGTGPQGVETPGMTHESAMHYIRWIHGEGIENLPPSERMGANSLVVAMEEWLKRPEAAIGYATRLQNLIESPRPVDTMGLYPTELEQPRPSDMDLEMLGNLGRMTGPSVSRPVEPTYPPPGLLWKEFLESAPPRPSMEMQNMQPRQHEEFLPHLRPGIEPEGGYWIKDGGYVGRGYAGGGYASRGTVAGELPRYGNMSVREEGETMRELSKRHRDQDWYNHMSGGLGSLRRRMA